MFKVESQLSKHIIAAFVFLVAISALLVNIGCGGLASASNNSKSGSTTVSASGSLPTTSQISLSPAQLSFGTVAVNTTTTQNLQITNTGTTTLTISQLNFTGGTVFSVVGAIFPLSIAAGNSANVQIAFAPTTSGSFTGSVSASSSTGNSPSAALAGSAATTVSNHSVALNWSASTSSVVGYFVYRGTASGGPYTKLIAAADPATTYTDSSVQSGVTYYYVVTAVNGNGVESAFSNQATAAVPTP